LNKVNEKIKIPNNFNIWDIVDIPRTDWRITKWARVTWETIIDWKIYIKVQWNENWWRARKAIPLEDLNSLIK
jgi:hypothetical protein